MTVIAILFEQILAYEKPASTRAKTALNRPHSAAAQASTTKSQQAVHMTSVRPCCNSMHAKQDVEDGLRQCAGRWSHWPIAERVDQRFG